MAKSIDWVKLKNEYVCTDISYRELGKKHGVSRSAISRRSALEDWVNERKEFQSKKKTKLARETLTKLAEQESECIVNINKINHKISEKLERIIDSMGDEPIETKESGTIKNLTSALKDIRDIQDSTLNSLGNKDKREFAGIPAVLLAKDFVDINRMIDNRTHRHYWFSGGRGSYKSSYCSYKLIEIIEKNPSFCGLVLRQVATTMRDSVFAQIEWAIDMLGLIEDYKIVRSRLEIEKISTGQKIFFRGADDPGKIKSIKPPKGMYIGVFWYEEFDQFYGMEAVRNINQSIIRGGNDFIGLYSYNTPKSKQHFVNIESDKAVDNRYVHSSNYLNVPKNWLGEAFIEEARILEKQNNNAYLHEYMGIAVGTGGVIFDNVEIREITNEEIGGMPYFYNGIDFGNIDPNVYLRTSYNRNEGILYITDELYSQFQKDKVFAENIIAKGYEKDYVLADNASPKSIINIHDYGVNIQGVTKFPGSVEIGIDWLRTLNKIVIDKKRCPNAAREFTLYELLKDKNDNFISNYPDKDNHTIDAARYALSQFIVERKAKIKK